MWTQGTEGVQMCDMEGYLGSCGEAGVLGLGSDVDLHDLSST